MAKQVRVDAFTAQFDGISNVLPSETLIAPAFDSAKKEGKKEFKKYNAIWDTGATKTVITKRVVEECGLKPTGMAKVYTASCETKSSVYAISIVLRNNVGITPLDVTEGNLPGDLDVLIGMDVINLGDFAVTNFKGKTAFSFRIPSIDFIDFVKQRPAKSKPLPFNVGRNAPCPCGSGKKYKKCCGK